MAANSTLSDFIAYLNESCSAFHAVDAAVKRLEQAGFTRAEAWEQDKLSPGKGYYFIRNGTTVIAFTVGGSLSHDSFGYTVVGAHTDSPCLKIKPVPVSKKSDSLVVNTQPYGGGLWHTWFDRDLGIAGRVICRSADGTIYSRLTRIDSPMARIPNLAIHLTSGSEREHFSPNLQEHGKAILTMDKSILALAPSPESARFHPYLLALISQNINVPVNEIVDLELQLIDIQPSTLSGLDNNEFVLSGRLDNLCSAYQALRALIDSTRTLQSQTNISIAMLFDHEEIGSASAQGAGSSLFMDTLKSLNDVFNKGSSHGMKYEIDNLVIIFCDFVSY